MSADHMTLSTSSERLNWCMIGSVLPVKRPPHSFDMVAAHALKAQSRRRARHGARRSLEPIQVHAHPCSGMRLVC